MGHETSFFWLMYLETRFKRVSLSLYSLDLVLGVNDVKEREFNKTAESKKRSF